MWIQCAIEHSVNMFQIFKIELLDGVELAVLSSPEFQNSQKDSFLDIEVDPTAYVKKWTKSADRYLFPQKNIYVTTNTVKLTTGQQSKQITKGESSTAAALRKEATEKGKNLASEEKETIFVDIFQDAQNQEDHEWESQYLDWLHQSQIGRASCRERVSSPV